MGSQTRMSRGRNDSQSVLSDLMECHLYTTSIKREDHLHFKKRHGKKKSSILNDIFLAILRERSAENAQSTFRSWSLSPRRPPAPQLGGCLATWPATRRAIPLATPPRACLLSSEARGHYLGASEPQHFLKGERILGFIVIILFVFVRIF